LNPLAYKPFDNQCSDFVVHRNGDCGSPRVSGETNSSWPAVSEASPGGPAWWCWRS
jgi:hypothetical protein